MTALLRYITIDCRDPRALATFWAAALDWEVVYDQPDGALLSDGSASMPKLFLQSVPEAKSGKNRAHVDLEVVDFDAELDRLLQLGATVLRADDATASRRSAVLADPQGNEFCLARAAAV